MLASSSRFRASVLAEAGIETRVEPPDVDERALDEQLASSPVEDHALVLAEAKARSVLERIGDGTGGQPAPLVIGADQLGVVGDGVDRLILHKRATVDEAVEQLMAMSGTTHRLVNGLVVIDGRTGFVERGIDVMEVTMRDFTRDEAISYVERFQPFDSAGSYRIEDQDEMSDGERFIVDVQGEDPTGVLGMPVPLLERMLASMRTRKSP